MACQRLHSGLQMCACQVCSVGFAKRYQPGSPGAHSSVPARQSFAVVQDHPRIIGVQVLLPWVQLFQQSSERFPDVGLGAMGATWLFRDAQPDEMHQTGAESQKHTFKDSEVHPEESLMHPAPFRCVAEIGNSPTNTETSRRVVSCMFQIRGGCVMGRGSRACASNIGARARLLLAPAPGRAVPVGLSVTTLPAAL